MPAKSVFRLPPQALAPVVLLAALLATWLAYAPGMGGSIHFDDPPNLQGLENIDDRASAVRFIATGTAGPLGRPLALASFIPEAHAWPTAPEVFLRTNILIHLLNGVLVTWLLFMIGLARGQTEEEAALIGVAAATIWMLMPLLASSSLFIVQRMTTLSALFVLLGAVGYLYARRAINRRPLQALLGMTLALGAGAILGALAKENGALLFVFILALEASLLDRPSSISRRLWRTWFNLVLVTPLAAIILYLALALPYPEQLILWRDFNGFERLMTQAEILWKYLYLAFFPHVPSLGPFHDDYPARSTLLNAITILSIFGWLAAIVAAILLKHKAPLFTFAISWYLLGHLLESTSLGLELYFEHRNYLPMVGPVYALVACILVLKPSFRRFALFGIAGYAVILGNVLFSVTSLWGSPVIAAEMWAIYKPDSTRATVLLIQSLERQGDTHTAYRVLDSHIEGNPDHQGLRIALLTMSCQSNGISDHEEEIRILEDTLPTTHFDFFVLGTYQKLDSLVRSQQCHDVDKHEIYRLGMSILDNPRYNIPVAKHNIHIVLSRIALEQGNFELTMKHIEKALRILPNADTLNLAVEVLNSAGLYDSSRELLNTFRQKTPTLRPLRALQWERDLDRLEARIIAFEQVGSSAN
jgi:protein O-mannosyl-transferase